VTALGIIVAAGIAVAGWFVAASQKREDDRREYRAKFLIDAWVTLEDAAERDDTSRLPALEGAIAKIQLLGTDTQIELARAFSEQMAQTSSGSLDALLADLRRNLQEELGFDQVDNAMFHFRVEPK
jgi:hypothetical protein